MSLGKENNMRFAGNKANVFLVYFANLIQYAHKYKFECVVHNVQMLQPIVCESNGVKYSIVHAAKGVIHLVDTPY